MASRYTIQSTTIKDKGLTVEWGDGHVSRYHPIWLRHQCECQLCGTPLNAVRSIRLHHIPDDISLVTLECAGEEIKISWSHDDHKSIYTARWLRDHYYSQRERTLRKHRPTLWNGRIVDDPPIADLTTAAEANPRARLAMLEAVRDFGFCKITSVPTEPDQSHR